MGVAISFCSCEHLRWRQLLDPLNFLWLERLRDFSPMKGLNGNCYSWCLLRLVLCVIIPTSNRSLLVDGLNEELGIFWDKLRSLSESVTFWLIRSLEFCRCLMLALVDDLPSDLIKVYSSILDSIIKVTSFGGLRLNGAVFFTGFVRFCILTIIKYIRKDSGVHHKNIAKCLCIFLSKLEVQIQHLVEQKGFESLRHGLALHHFVQIGLALLHMA